jgi:glucokinase
MDSQKSEYLAIDTGGTFLKSAVLNEDGDVREGSGFVTRSFSEGSREQILGAFRTTILHGINYLQRKGEKPVGIGIAFPGPFDYEKGTSMMQHKFQALYGIDLFQEIFSIPEVSADIPVKFMSDTNTVLAGEIWKGNAIGFDNVAVVTLGTGLGFAFSEGGVIMSNGLGGPQIRIFSLPYRQGILEDYASKRGLIRIFHEISGNKNTGNMKVSDIGRWAEEGDLNSIRTFAEVGRILGESLSEVIRERNIQCLLFGGQISRSFRFMEVDLKNGFQDVGCLQKISPVKNIDNAAFIGILKTLISH